MNGRVFILIMLLVSQAACNEKPEGEKTAVEKHAREVMESKRQAQDDEKMKEEKTKEMKTETDTDTDTDTDTNTDANTEIDRPEVAWKRENIVCKFVQIEGFVDLYDISDLRFDIRYATSRNFTGAPLPGYEKPGAMLRKEPADALGRVVEKLKEKNLSLVVFDAYRPARASRAMVKWARRTGRDDLVENKYISAVSSHNRGTAVDVSLVDRETGKPLSMGSDFDDFSSRSHTSNAKGDAMKNRLLLRDAMRAEGFQAISTEWWHFSYEVEGARRMDVPYECINVI